MAHMETSAAGRLASDRRIGPRRRGNRHGAGVRLSRTGPRPNLHPHLEAMLRHVQRWQEAGLHRALPSQRPRGRGSSVPAGAARSRAGRQDPCQLGRAGVIYLSCAGLRGEAARTARSRGSYVHRVESEPKLLIGRRDSRTRGYPARLKASPFARSPRWPSRSRG